MGCYVNPQNETKEGFLEREGVLWAGNSMKWEQVPPGMLPVILLNNFTFSAAGVAYKESELAEFTRPDDFRPRKIYLVLISKLEKVSDIKMYLNR